MSDRTVRARLRESIRAAGMGLFVVWAAGWPRPASLAAEDGLRAISFYVARPASTAPVIDGRLDDDCWSEANRHDAYYEYRNADPGPGALKTEFRMVYDAFGVYLAVVNHVADPAALRMDIEDRDSPLLWRDDCAELYFDSQATGIGYRNFTVSAKGVVADRMRTDAAVASPEWNGDGWLAKTRVTGDAWTLEAFFPWEDLGATASAGDVWMFCHARFGYPEGKFVGAVSAPGASYMSSDRFGYVYFSAPGETPSPDAAAAALARALTPPWALELGGELLCDRGLGTERLTLADLLAVENEACARTAAEIEARLGDEAAKAWNGKFAELRDAWTADRAGLAPDFAGYRRAANWRDRLDQFKWQLWLRLDFGA